MFEPLSPSARQNMNMKVEHGLPGRFAIKLLHDKSVRLHGAHYMRRKQISKTARKAISTTKRKALPKPKPKPRKKKPGPKAKKPGGPGHVPTVPLTEDD